MEPSVHDAQMVERLRFWVLAGLLTWTLLLPAAVLSQSPVAVLHTEGLVHGFLVLRTLEGNALADGEVTQVARGDRVTSHLVFGALSGNL
jgi:hypothetical protein